MKHGFSGPVSKAYDHRQPGNGIVCGISDPNRLDGNRNRMRRDSRVSYTRHRVAGGIHGGLAENLMSSAFTPPETPARSGRIAANIQ
jgi:hypothetical protein